MIRRSDMVFGALFLLVFLLSIIFPGHNLWLMLVLIVLIVVWLMTSKKFWKKVNKKCREIDLVGEEEAPQ